ncbi:MAG: ATP-binding protein [Candidatus Sumerlaeota bacterium]|nr:ATP-binding protein [Candidatus Sumerlaeota bacterium]
MFIGREDHLNDLNQLMRKRCASLVTCRGRRRIGKSTLIREFGKRAARFLAFEGLPPRTGLSNQDQLQAFSRQLAQQTDLPALKLDNWPQAFQLLASAIRNEWTVILLDEISWLGGFDPDFCGHLKTAWDNVFRKRSKLILVLCGSVSSWINDNILNNTGFAGRDSWDILLDELPLHDCNQFWGAAGERMSADEKLTVLSITGGVPKYLEEIDPGVSADENIRRLCFRRQGILFREFEQIFSDVFGKRATSHREIVTALEYGSKTVSEISEAIGKERSGHLSENLRDLVLGGFLAKDVVFDPKTGRNTRIEKYRLRDNYSRFYLRYIAPRREGVEKGLMRGLSLDQLPEWQTILGLQFENLILNNIQPLAQLMHLARTPLLAAAPYVQKKTARKKGCQIDLLIRTKHALYLVEVKRRKSIEASVIEEVKEKACNLRAGADLSVRTALVYEGRLDPRVEEEGYFDFLIPFSRLLTSRP